MREIHDTLAQSFSHLVKTMIHNLTTLNAHSIQEVYALVPQETLTGNLPEQLATIQTVLRRSPERAARTILRIAKNNLAVKSEFAAMRLLDPTATRPALRSHDVRKVVLNVLHAYFQDFTDRAVHVIVRDTSFTVDLDYDSFHVAISHIIDNAAKYVMPASELTVSFERGTSTVKIVFDMFSLPIPPDELPQIGTEGFSGSCSQKLGLAGHGLGMYLTKKLLHANHASIEVIPNLASKTTRRAEIEYQRNQFVVILHESPPRGRRYS